jgi:thiamine biosynthesis protein ThiS
MTTLAPPGATATMVVTVNGEPHLVAAGSTARDVVAALGCEGRPLAVEVNEAVVPRASLAGCMLADGDRLEIVTLVGGG